MRNSIRPTLAALLFWTLASSGGGLAEVGYRSHGRARPSSDGAASGGPFQLDSRIAPRQASRGGGYVLTPPGFPSPAGEAASGAGCFCGGLIFADDFESGNTGAWSAP